MQQLKSGLTRLKNRVLEKISEEVDVLGFPGVNRQDIVGFIERAYGLTSRLEALRGSFAIVALKRKVIPALDACKAALDAATGDSPDKGRFDEFLNALTKIHDDIYMTYVVFCSDGINIEADIGSAHAALSELNEKIKFLEPVVRELEGSLDSIQELHSTAETTLAAQRVMQGQGATILADLEKAKTSALASAEVLSKYEANAKNEQDIINSLARKANKTDQQIKNLMAEIQGKTSLIDAVLARATSAAEENEKQQREIARTLEAASKYGMAVSFKERKDELRFPMLLWGGVFILAIAALFTTGVLYILPEIKEGNAINGLELLIRIPLVAPLVWLGWVAAKQYGYVARIREDYSFKYASALAFEGYKKEALSVDPDMLRDLLSVATKNMAFNPLRIYSSEGSDESPFHDLLSRIFRCRMKHEEPKEDYLKQGQG